MREKDLSVVKELMDHVYSRENTNAFVIVETSFTQIAKTNLLLLKGFLDLNNKKGYFVVLDRPHQYMSYLLNMHDVTQENIHYIDTVSDMSGEEKVDEGNVDFITGPYHIDDLFGIIDRDDQNEVLLKDKIDFILVDNISSMLNYNTMGKVEEFVRSFKRLIKGSKNLMGCMVIDSESYPELNRLIDEESDERIFLEDFMEVEKR